jgi:hypothetical protein
LSSQLSEKEANVDVSRVKASQPASRYFVAPANPSALHEISDQLIHLLDMFSEYTMPARLKAQNSIRGATDPMI